MFEILVAIALNLLFLALITLRLLEVSVWVMAILYLIGAFSCLVTFYVVSSFYQGHIYRLVSLPLVLVSFIVFSVWPASARAFYGWFFDFF